MPLSDTQSVLSVCVITYNHEHSIARALESILSQETNFKFEIVVFDDASSDGTCDVIAEICKRNPHRINLVKREVNVGAGTNWIELLNYPNSKYIAYLEGDDYWTDSHKLQCQFDCMEADVSISLCFHDVLLHNMTSNLDLPFPSVSIKDKLFTVKDIILRSWFIPSGSIFFRAALVKAIPRDCVSVPNGDFILLYLASVSGDILRIPKVMGVYNYLALGSMSSNLGSGLASRLQKLRNIKVTSKYLYHRALPLARVFLVVRLAKINLLLVHCLIKLSLDRAVVKSNFWLD